jgi:hypothetical protein
VFRSGSEVRVLTPGSTAGEPVHILSSLERRSASWDSDPEASRAAVSAAISLVLRLLGKDPDPAKSREHVLLSVLAERRMQRGQSAELGALMNDVLEPPVDRIGALDVDDFLSIKDRKNLAAALNTLLAAPTFSSWRQGVSLDIREWLTPKNGRTPAVIVSVAHLEDDERALVLGVLLEEILAYTRSLPGTRRLRALVVFDECYGLLPPHPAKPPTKRPTVALMKQARAFGVGVIVASQNPMDLDYRALSNAGFWAVGRPADRRRSRTRRRQPGERQRKGQLGCRAHHPDPSPRPALVLRARRALQAQHGAAPAPLGAVLFARAHDARGHSTGNGTRVARRRVMGRPETRERLMAEINIAFWNVENLFDTTASPIATDLEFTPEQGWTPEVFDRKLENLASIIRQMHGGDGPDLLGLCEVENVEVVARLLEAIGEPKYRVAHVESPDIRGIDCSLIYSTDVFSDPAPADIAGHLVHFRYPTRDIFQVRLRVKENDAELNVLVNHWPSRRRGAFESEPHRITVAERCGQLVDEILKLDRKSYEALPNSAASFAQLTARWNRNVLLMGDLNDEPFNRSVTDYLLASKDLDKVEEELRAETGQAIPALQAYLEKTPVLFNLSWSQLAVPDHGTFFFGSGLANTMNLLDQFIVSRGLQFGASRLKVRSGSAEVFRAPDMTTAGKQRPRAFDRKRLSGYSDHFPIQATIDTVP